MARGRAYEAALATIGLHFSPRSVEAMGHSPAGAAPQLKLGAGPFAIREHIVCLGVALDVRGSTDAMCEHRPREVQGLRWRWNRQLSFQRVSLEERVRHLRAPMVSCMLLGSQLWTLARRLSDFIDSAELRWLRRTTFECRPSGEEWISCAGAGLAPFAPARRAAATRPRGVLCSEPSKDGGAMFNATRRARPMRWAPGCGEMCRPYIPRTRFIRPTLTGIGTARYAALPAPAFDLWRAGEEQMCVVHSSPGCRSQRERWSASRHIFLRAALSPESAP